MTWPDQLYQVMLSTTLQVWLPDVRVVSKSFGHICAPFYAEANQLSGILG